jgi:hypothetical protein
MGLAKILELVGQRVVDATSLAGEKNPSFAIGEPERYREELPPRVVWIPQRAQRSDKQRQSGPAAQRHLVGRVIQVEARIWAESFEAMESLTSHVVAALYGVLLASFAYLSEAFTLPTDTEMGFRNMLVFQVQVPLRDEPLTTVAPTEAPITGTFEDPT